MHLDYRLEQNQAHYMKTIHKCQSTRLRTVCPALLMQIPGPRVNIWVAIYAQGTYFDPVVTMLPNEQQGDDDSCCAGAQSSEDVRGSSGRLLRSA
jgi:hypothetical protein